jgi:hypothetical protein
MKTLTLLIFSFLTLFAQDPVIYTIEGKKDPRLEARYIVSYVSTGTSEECTTRKLSTGTRRPVIGSKVYEVKDENYSIKIPIALTEDENNCGYRIGGLELIMRRKNDDDQYSLFQLLGDYRRYTNTQEPLAVYHGFKGGVGGGDFVGMNRKERPSFTNDFSSNKKYFRIAPETTFVCMTQNRIFDFERPKKEKELAEKYKPYGDFMCIMQMKLDTEGGKYHFNECTQKEFLTETQHRCGSVSHPDFGVDEITSDTLHIDILVDESKCQLLKISRFKVDREPDTFREVPKPTPSALESLKSLF